MVHILYNPTSNCAVNIAESIVEAESFFSNDEITKKNLLEIKDMRAYFEKLEPSDKIVLLGGDGTLNVFCNNLRGCDVNNEIYLFKAGTGNDFLRDVCGCDFENTKILKINEYIENLPVVTVNSKEYLFVNNVGFGIDGKVCTAAEDLREKGKKSINYTTLAIKLLLTNYKPNGATVVVDNKRRKFKRVWMAPVMNGLYYGGGMMPTPQQDRKSDLVSTCIVHSTNPLQTLIIFPSIFKGEHVKHTKKVANFSGKEIEIEFDAPQDVQIDGETIRDVTKISVSKFKTLNERDAKLKTIKV